ncbi:MAG: hypothetical protein ACLRVQ_04970 [Lachnospiraceae bacterium]
MKLKKIGIILAVCIISISIMSCGSKKITEQSEGNETEKETEKFSLEETENTKGNRENMRLDIKSNEIEKISIKDGNTGMDFKIMESSDEINDFTERLNNIIFENTQKENQTGWLYMRTITYKDSATENITVTSNELIYIVSGDNAGNYKTDYNLSGYLEELFKE